MEILRLDNACKAYHMGDEEQVILNRIHLHVNQGDFVSILGPSGSGKSTLMNIIGCLDSADRGEYYFESKLVSDLDETELAAMRNQKIGFVFQQFQLLAKLNALNNVELPLIYAGIPSRERTILAEQALIRVGLGDKLKHKPPQLSGGQQQRVAIARALVTTPSILLADEPTGALDQKNSHRVMGLFQDLHKEGKTIVMITHDEEIARYADRIIHLSDGKLKEETHYA